MFRSRSFVLQRTVAPVGVALIRRRPDRGHAARCLPRASNHVPQTHAASESCRGSRDFVGQFQLRPISSSFWDVEFLDHKGWCTRSPCLIACVTSWKRVLWAESGIRCTKERPSSGMPLGSVHQVTRGCSEQRFLQILQQWCGGDPRICHHIVVA